jgi:hypothetical protein
MTIHDISRSPCPPGVHGMDLYYQNIDREGGCIF